MKIPYTLVSMAAILRDHADMSNAYMNTEHKRLVDIADSLYNVGIDPDEFLPAYKELYSQYGKPYFDQVLDDMYALDGQLTSDAKVQELIDDYIDRFSGITASTKVTATEDNSYNQHLVQVSKEDKQYVLNNLNNSHKTVGMGGAGDPGYYVSEFEPAYGLYLWASDTGLRILDDNGIEYTEVKKAVGASTKVTAATNYDTKLIAKWLKAKFDDEAFGTAYTMHRISDADAYMSRNGLTYNRRNNTIDLWKSGGDEDIPVYKVIPQYSSTKRQGTYAPKMPKLVPIDEWNATHGVTASTRVMASRWYYYEPMSEQELADFEADILALPGCDKLDMDTDGMEEMGHICILPGYNDISLSDPQWYEKRKQLLKDILRVAKEHGLSRTEDTIEDYGSCWYIVLRTNKPKTDEYEEYDY